MFGILIAEDDKGTRRLMEDTLADAGYEPISAADGQEALELLTRKHVDLLILDVMMPRLDGFALLAALRRSGSQLPVLMLTAKEALADKKHGLRLGGRRLHDQTGGRRGNAAAHPGTAAPCAGHQQPSPDGGRHHTGV